MKEEDLVMSSGKGPVLRYLLTSTRDGGPSLSVKQILRGEESLSSLYSYELLVASPGRDAASQFRALLGEPVHLQATLNMTTGHADFLSVYGIVTSVVSGPVELYEDSSQGWFKVVVEPAFSRACYSRNRAVYTCTLADEKNLGCVAVHTVLKSIVERWTGKGSCQISQSAIKRVPPFLQLVQNDESDYNFFCRLLATWGLGYYWEMDEDNKKEVLHVYDALDSEIIGKDAPLPCMASRGADSSSWSIHSGFHSLAKEDVGVQNYLSVFGSQNSTPNRIKLSLHDETWDHLLGKAAAAAAYGVRHYLNSQFNANSVHGSYLYSCVESQFRNAAALRQVAALHLGARVTWAEHAAYDTAGYFLTKRVVTADREQWRVEFTGRAVVKVLSKDADKDSAPLLVGGGVLPRPLVAAADPDLNEGTPLLREAPWDSPKPRTFMAVVVTDKVRDYQGRNFCQVCEVEGEPMWVEMGSPSADSESGILARPRVGNVLFCLDRGDLSIPIAISAMFRGKAETDNDVNKVPLAELLVMDRHKREMQDARVNDNSALTLRSRTHVPERTYTDGTKGDARDKSITADDLEFVQRPQSVEDLAEHPKPFSQIQMFSLDNGVKPIKQDPQISETYCWDSVTETIAGFVSECDYTAGYAASDVANTVQTERNTPVTRPHLQGISMYSSGDIITQSADHQITNAGGEIVLSAAQAITLRVGKSFVRISEYGVEISSTAGLVDNAGAYPAYHTEDDAENDMELNGNGLPLSGGHIMVNGAGVYNKGSYIANTAVNMFTANTILGSDFTLTDFSGRLYAPAVNIIGGAAIENTVLSMCKDIIFGATGNRDIRAANSVYTGSLEDGYKTSGYNAAAILNGIIPGLCNTVSFFAGFASICSNVKNLFSVTGSMIKMLPERMVLSSAARFDYSTEATKVSSAASGLIASAENLAFSLSVSGNISFGKTLAMLVGTSISNMHGSGDDSGTATDTFTGSDVGQPDDAPGSSDADGSLVAAGVGLAVGGFLGLISTLCNPAEVMAQCLFGKRKDELVGIESEETLTSNVVAANASETAAAKQRAIAQLDNAYADALGAVATAQRAVVSDNVQKADRVEAVNAAVNTINTLSNTIASANAQVAAEIEIGNTQTKTMTMTIQS